MRRTTTTTRVVKLPTHKVTEWVGGAVITYDATPYEHPVYVPPVKKATHDA